MSFGKQTMCYSTLGLEPYEQIEHVALNSPLFTTPRSPAGSSPSRVKLASLRAVLALRAGRPQWPAF